MHVICFDCEARVEADGLDELAEAYVAHARTAHRWDYPDSSIRNYARNYAEALTRLTGPTERLARIDPIAVHRVTEERIADWLHFFDHEAFAGNPGWASCYCLEPHIAEPVTEPERPWRHSRSAMVARLRDGSAYGYLAYAGERVAGWVNASLRSDYGIFGEPESDPPPSSIVGVSCFVVAPPFRRHGVASALLDRIIDDAPSRSAAWVEAYPHTDPEQTDAGHFRGPRAMYEARGFEVVADGGRFTVMRKRVG